jgi:hypothetical protein
MTNPTKTELIDPRLADQALAPYVTALQSLGWLTNVYGKAVRYPVGEQISDGYVPAVFVGSDASTTAQHRYLKLLPDVNLGSFSFFDVGPYSITNNRAPAPLVSFPFGLVVWYDYRQVYSDAAVDQSEANVMAQVYTALNGLRGTGHELTLESVVTLPLDVYRGYEVRDMRATHLVRPYGLFRIDGTLTFLHDLTCP